MNSRVRLAVWQSGAPRLGSSDNGEVSGWSATIVSDIRESFDSAWYLREYPEVAQAQLDPVRHYLETGAAKGYNPHPLFDTAWYREQYPDVTTNPFEHYVNYGGYYRNPHPLFDTAWYLAHHPDVAASGMNPLRHYLQIGAAAGYDPHPLFSTTWYVAHNPDVSATGVNPLVHYLSVGGPAGRDPNPNFDTAGYLRQFPDLAATRTVPLLHYLRRGGLPVPSPGRRRTQIVRGAGIGDVLLLTPLLSAMRANRPDDEIVVTTIYPQIFENNPYVDYVVKALVPCEGCDETFVLDYEMTPDDHIVDAYARILGVSVNDRTPELYLSHDERIAASALLHDAGVRVYQRFCAMQLSSGWPVRDWPLERFAEVASALEAEGLRVVVLGAQADPPIGFGVDLRGKTSLRTAAAIIEKCSLMITIDSALMHVALSFRRPVISLFGCTDADKRVPDWALSTALGSDIPCRGCHHRQRPLPAVFAPICQWESVRCMEQLSVAMVLSKARAELARIDNPVVSIILLHYNKYHLVEACLNSIFRHGARCSFEVIVVANGSPPEHVERLQAWRPHLRILKLEPNRGYSEGNNAGAKAARGKYLLLLNDDTTVTPGWLDALVDFARTDPSAGIIGPKLLYPNNDNGIQHCGTVFNEHSIGEHIYRHRPADFEAADRPRYFRAITAACVLIERDLFLQLGGFDPSYGKSGGCEDTDLCFKLLELGKRPAYCPSSVVYHHESVTRGIRDEHHPEELFSRKLLRERWSKYLVPDISEYLLLAEIEAAEGRIWRWLQDVPEELVVRYRAAAATHDRFAVDRGRPISIGDQSVETNRAGTTPPAVVWFDPKLAPGLCGREREDFLREVIGWDGDWYLARYPDIAEGIKRGRLLDPLQHYLEHGRLEGRFVSAADQAARGSADHRSAERSGQLRVGGFSVPFDWPVRGEIGKTFLLRFADGFFEKYMSGAVILDIGFKGGHDGAVPIFPHAIGVDVDFPGYDGIRLPFSDESVDTVFASHVLEHVIDYRLVIRDWFRVVRTGGFIVCLVPHQFLYERKLVPPSNWNGDHKRFYTPASLLREFEESLEPNHYRIRHLADNDFGYIYEGIPPEQHAAGCYEIELVVQKIKPDMDGIA